MRGVSTSPRSSSRSPAPSLPRGQAHSSPPTPTPRGPNTGRGPALLPARCQPQPSPAARPGMMLALQGFASYKTLGHGTPLPGRELELGAGGRDGHAQGSQCPRSQSPDRHWDRLAREGTGCSGRGHSRGHQPLGCSRSFRDTACVCCHVVQLPCACSHSWGSPGTPKVEEQCVYPRAAWPLISVSSECQPGRGTRKPKQALPWGCSCKTTR